MSEPFDPLEALKKMGIENLPEEVSSEEIFGKEDAPLELTVEDSGNPKDKLGLTKAPLSSIPPAGILYLGAGMAEGARKYGAFNWRGNKVKSKVYVEAMMRHLLQYLDGEDIDPESGVPHMGHIMAGAAIVADATETGNLLDDRPKPGAAGNMIRRWTPEGKFNSGA